eukprot:tig00001542_g9328.t1
MITAARNPQPAAGRGPVAASAIPARRATTAITDFTFTSHCTFTGSTSVTGTRHIRTPSASAPKPVLHAERATPEHHNCSGHDKRPPSSLKRVAPVEVPIENQLELSPELLRDAYELQRTPAFKEKRERRGSVNCRPGDVIRVRIKEARFPHAADTHIVVKWNHKEVARTPSVLSSSHPVFNFPFSIRLADGDCGLSFEAVRERLFRDSVVGAVDVPLSAVMPGDSEEFWFRIRCANHTHSVQGALLLHVEHYRERYRLKESARRPGGVHGKLRNAPPPEPPREPAPCEDCTTATARRAHGGAAGRAVGDCCGPLAGNHSVRSSESRESAPSSGSHLVSPPRHTPDGRPPRPAPAPAPSTRPDLSVIRLKHPPPLEPPEVPA